MTTFLAPATQANVATLRGRGVHVIDPASGALGSGDSGIGRLPEPREIARRALEVLARAEKADSAPHPGGPDRVVTAGGTREPIDPVRFLGNKRRAVRAWPSLQPPRAQEPLSASSPLTSTIPS